MFDWFWEFLYMLSKTLFMLIDSLISCANKLCGIDPISFAGEDNDFLSYLIFSDEIGFAFRVSAILATILLVVFSVFMIIRSIAKDKAEGTPAQIAVKAFKTLVTFFLVPTVVIAFITLGNIFVKALYSATMQNSAAPGTFLFSAFAEQGGMGADYVAMFKSGELDYYNTDVVKQYMDIADFPYFFSFIAGGVVLFGIGSAMLVFVDRVLSLVILYVAAPVSISTSVIDDGARFKLWRDQFLSKFIMGYGMILAINIYALICGLVMSGDFHFFPGEDSKTVFLDLIMKLLIIAGGALNIQKAMGLIGNLVSQGAGSNELRDSMSAGSLAKMAAGAAMGIGGKALSIAGGALSLPFKPAKDIVGNMYSGGMKRIADYALDKMTGADKKSGGEKDSDSKNNEKAKYGSENKFKTAFNPEDKKWKDSPNDQKDKEKKDDAVSTAIQGTDNKNEQGTQTDGGQQQGEDPAGNANNGQGGN